MAKKEIKKPKQSARVVRGSNPRPASAKRGSSAGAAGRSAVKSFFLAVCKVFITIMLVSVIIVCIVGTALTVFVMNYINDNEGGIDLNTIEAYSNTLIYGKDGDGNDVVMQKLRSGGRQDYVGIEEIPDLVIDAFVYTEDQRFRDHEGVDWQRTIVSFVRLLVVGDDSMGGGSTISQQLIKTLNEDTYNRSVDVKVKEILGALRLEKHNTKEDILEAYLNNINLGSGNIGVKAAAKYYFDKELDELTPAEAASLAATTKSPENINILKNPVRNKERRDYSLSKMLEFEAITKEQYQEAVANDLVPVDRTGDNSMVDEGENKVYNWYVDDVVRQVRNDLMDKYGWTSAQAMSKLNGGGYQIFTPCNMAFQDYLTNYFLNDKNFDQRKLDHSPEGAMVVMDYQGYVAATVGSRNEKEQSLVFSRATGQIKNDPMAGDIRSPGSTFKPISTYALAIQQDMIKWSDKVVDAPKLNRNSLLKGDKNWPNNYSRKYLNQAVSVEDALMVSLNTVPVELFLRLTDNMQNRQVYDFLENQLHITTMDPKDIAAPASVLGSLTRGITLEELCTSYIMFGNNGRYNSAKYYSKVVDLNGKVILENEPENSFAISADTAWIMNRLLKKTVDGGSASNGLGPATGRQAKFNNGLEVVGKTGTADNAEELSFVGLTPNYIAAVRFGYDQKDKEGMSDSQKNIEKKVYKPQVIWKDVMENLISDDDPKKFSEVNGFDDGGAEEISYCTTTGLRARSGCPKATGWFKQKDLQDYCGLH